MMTQLAPRVGQKRKPDEQLVQPGSHAPLLPAGLPAGLHIPALQPQPLAMAAGATAGIAVTNNKLNGKGAPKVAAGAQGGKVGKTAKGKGAGKDDDGDVDVDDLGDPRGLISGPINGDEPGSRKEKSVKVKKIFLRILRKVMDVPQDSPLLRVWRDNRMAKKSGKQLPAGWYGIEVMDVEEVDATLLKLLPSMTPAKVGNQDPRITMAEILQIGNEVVEGYITLKKGRYRLNEGKLTTAGKDRVTQLRALAKQLHTEVALDQPPGTADGGGGSGPGPGQHALPVPHLPAYPPPQPLPPAANMLPEYTAFSAEAQAAAAAALLPRSAPHMPPTLPHSLAPQLNPGPSLQPQAGHPPPNSAVMLSAEMMIGLSQGFAAPSAPAPTAHAHLPPLRCLDCNRIIPCSCPLHNRQVVFPESTYADAVNINKVGEAFQTMWEQVDHLPMEALELLVYRISHLVHEAVQTMEPATQ